MITDGKVFDTNVLFPGGAGMFVQYHDIIKPVYLYAIVKMILMGESFGLPIDIVAHMSNLSLIEWYLKRRYINPFKCLDYNHYADDDKLDEMMCNYLLNDDSIYSISPTLNFLKLLDVYRQGQMSFPIYVYSKNQEPFIADDCNKTFKGVSFRYVYGDLENCIKSCEQNFTYIFSDIELVKRSAEILTGTCSNVLLSQDYRYNYIDNCKTFKYNLSDIAQSHPFIRIGTTIAMNPFEVAGSFTNLSTRRTGLDASSKSSQTD